MDFSTMPGGLLVLAQVVMIDVALAGDNAVVVGIAVSGLSPRYRRRAIMLGVAGATLLRVVLGSVALQLLEIIGLTLAGGLLLLWVCWRMYRELRASRRRHGEKGEEKTLGQAITQIVLADLSMSLDNVMAVAGAAHGHPWILVTGLALSVVLMGLAASVISKLLTRYRWIAWVGLAIVLRVAVGMIWSGGWDVAHWSSRR